MLLNLDIELTDLKSDNDKFLRIMITLKNKETGSSTNFIREFYEVVPDNVTIVDSLIKDGIFGKLSYPEFCYLLKENSLSFELLDKTYKECCLINKKLTDLLGNYELSWGKV